MEWEKQETMRLLQGRPGTMYQEASDADKAEIRKWLKSILRVGTTTIDFVKADGSIRTMKATLDHGYIPAATSVNESKKPPAENLEVCRVWDTEAGAWRSFRYDRIKRISLEIG